jgi:hypothetical protein
VDCLLFCLKPRDNAGGCFGVLLLLLLLPPTLVMQICMIETQTPFFKGTSDVL